MDWTIGHLDHWTIIWTICLDHFWTIFFFWDHFIAGGGESGEVDHQYLGRGEMQSISTRGGREVDFCY